MDNIVELLLYTSKYIHSLREHWGCDLKAIA